MWLVPIARATFDRCAVMLGGSATWGLLTIDNWELSVVRVADMVMAVRIRPKADIQLREEIS